MTQKINYTILIALTLLLTISGCDKFLDEDLRDELTVENYFNNDKEAETAVNGLYRVLHNFNLYNNRGTGLETFYSHGADESTATRPGADPTNLMNDYLIAEGVMDGKDAWANLYELVRNCNLVIANVEGNERLSEKGRNRWLGEALFLRSLAYYNLTNLWGDVPYFNEVLSLDEMSTMERIQKEVIRSDMKNDLNKAFGLLPDSYSNQDLGRATKWAALTLKAKFHLFDEEWQLVKNDCVKIINESPHRLLDDFAAVFDQTDPANQYNAETIFAIDFTDIPGVASTFRTDYFNPRIIDEPKDKSKENQLRNSLRARGENFNGFAITVPLPEMADRANWDPDDLRYDVSIVTEYLGFELNYPYYRKNWNLLSATSPRFRHPENFVIFRLADVYLMAAEAENELNGPGNAYSYVNKVRERAFDPDKPWSGLSQSIFRKKMYDERKFELCAEGHRRLDLIRWGILLDVIRSTGYPINSPGDNIQPRHNLLPIPLEEILLNPNLLNTDPTNNGYR